jgi:hypothetical protein
MTRSAFLETTTGVADPHVVDETLPPSSQPTCHQETWWASAFTPGMRWVGTQLGRWRAHAAPAWRQRVNRNAIVSGGFDSELGWTKGGPGQKAGNAYSG